MKILFMTAECSNDISFNYLHYLEQAVAKIAKCKWAGHGHKLHIHGENLNDTILRVMPDADWAILHDSIQEKFKNAIKIPKKRLCKIAYSTSDIRPDPPRIVQRLNAGKWDAFLMQVTKTNVSFKENVNYVKKDHDYYIKHLNASIFYMATSINPKIFKPLDQPKKYDVSFLGSHNPKFYPLRAVMWKELPALAKQNKWRLLIRDRPRGHAFSSSRKIDEVLKKGYIVGSKYAEALALSKILIFSAMRGLCPVKKYYEGMACGTCVLANMPITGEELHFRPNWNFVEINKANWVRKLKYYLAHNDQREQIAKRGYETIMKYHTNDIRARQLVKFLEKHS